MGDSLKNLKQIESKMDEKPPPYNENMGSNPGPATAPGGWIPPPAPPSYQNATNTTGPDGQYWNPAPPPIQQQPIHHQASAPRHYTNFGKKAVSMTCTNCGSTITTKRRSETGVFQYVVAGKALYQTEFCVLLDAG